MFGRRVGIVFELGRAADRAVEQRQQQLAAAAARQGTAGLNVLLLWWLVVSWPRAVPLVRRASDCCVYVLCPYVCVIYTDMQQQQHFLVTAHS